MSVMTVTSIDKARALRSKLCYKPARRMAVGDAALAKAAKQAFIENLWHLMDFRGISAKDLAAALGITPAAVSNWKTGVSFPAPEQYDKIAAALDAPLFLLLWDPSDERTRDPRWIAIADLVDTDDVAYKTARSRLLKVREALVPARSGEMSLEDALKIVRDRPGFGDDDEAVRIAQVLVEHYQRGRADRLASAPTAARASKKNAAKKSKTRKRSARN